MNKQVQINSRKIQEKMDENSIMILFSGHEIKRSADSNFPFVVNRNTFHLTNINEPHQILVLEKQAETLYIEPIDEDYEKWMGKKIRRTEAETKSGIKDIRYVDEFKEDFLNLRKHKPIIYLDLEEDNINDFPTISHKFIKEFNLNSAHIKDAYPIIAASRAIKSQADLSNMRKAIEITNEAYQHMLKNFRFGVKESYYEAHFDFVLKKYNVIPAYDSICAAGKNATVLHYVSNNDIAKEGELVLFDMGATYNLMSADISRTFPTTGKFTKEQAYFYELVLEAEELVIKAIKPGVTMNELNQIVIDFYARNLKEIGLIDRKEEVNKYYYHGVSHSLGLDVHDVGLDRDDPLQPGHVITVEPGLYIEEKNLGIRIEDNILVTEEGHENLSKDIIKSIKDIERFMDEK